MKKTPFPKVTLTPCNEIDMSILDSLGNDICDSSIKKVFREHVLDYCKAHRLKFPTETKEFSIVPFGSFREACTDYNLYFPEYAALYLISVALNVRKIRSVVPEHLKDSPIIACDNNFSFFTNQRLVLAVDLSWEEAQFVFWKDQRYDFNPKYQFLAEPKS